MALDLKLLPIREHDSYSHEIINVEREHETFEKIKKLCPVENVLAGFHSYLSRSGDGPTCYGLTVDTPYEEPLQYTKAAHLKPFLAGPEGAFVNALPDSCKIALYWC